jgi:two-component system, OmpR family, phosphate regulon response regulator OmpR
MTSQPATKPVKVAVLDDEAELRALLQRYLTGRGFTVRAAADASQLDRLLQRESFDVLVLDLTLPGEDGLCVCRRLRAQGETIPILMLTARGDPVDRIVGLEMGADDYLPKPFDPRELVARIQAMVRRQHFLGAHGGASVPDAIEFGPFTLDLATRRLSRGGREIELTGGEYALLEVLARHSHRPLSRERLIDLAYGREHDATDRSIDVQVLRLRRLIEVDPAKPRYIQTVRNVGYVFVPVATTP